VQVEYHHIDSQIVRKLAKLNEEYLFLFNKIISTCGIDNKKEQKIKSRRKEL
jgi:hypothetical protein